MRKPDGVLICTGADGSEVHLDTYRCVHCGLPWAVRAKHRDTDIGGWCQLCFGSVCPNCAAHGRCDPFERAIERVEARGRALRSYDLG